MSIANSLKGPNGIFSSEFAFSLDNLGHIVFMPWFTIHENDSEATLVAELAGALHADRYFWPIFSQRVDELLNQNGICVNPGDTEVVKAVIVGSWEGKDDRGAAIKVTFKDNDTLTGRRAKSTGGTGKYLIFFQPACACSELNPTSFSPL